MFMKRQFLIPIPDQNSEYNYAEVRTADLGVLETYRFVVVFARYLDKWLYCRANSRDTFETAGGHIEPGESTLDAAKRELFEETGAIKFDIEPENGRCVLSYLRNDSICDIWLFRQDHDINDVTLQENETIDAKYASADEIHGMIKNKEFLGFDYIEDLFEKARL